MLLEEASQPVAGKGPTLPWQEQQAAGTGAAAGTREQRV